MMMTVYGILAGIFLGLTLQSSSLIHPVQLRSALALRSGSSLKIVLACLGWGAILTSFLGWLAVLDVDLLQVQPLSGAVLIGGAFFGLGVTLSGRTPLTSLGGIGGSAFVESFCTAAGCILGTMFFPFLNHWTATLSALPPSISGTFFCVTLDESFLYQGGFLGQGCIGAFLLALALWIPVPKPVESAPDSVIPSESQAEEVTIVTLEGEEPLVIPAEDPEDEEDFPYTDEEELPDEEPESPDV